MVKQELIVRGRALTSDDGQMFYSTAMHYYIAGRFAAFAGLAPVVGNLLHHAIEMCLKGGLLKTKTLAELRKLSHDLPAVWNEFKLQFNDPALAQFDSVISALHKFEDLRYPDSVLAQGMLCTVSIKRSSSTTAVSSAGRLPPRYDLCLEEIDNLVANIFSVASVNPKFFMGGLNKRAKQQMIEENVGSGLASE